MNKKVETDYWRHECTRCTYVWYSRVELPQGCLTCKTPYWNQKRVKKFWQAKAKIRKTRQNG